jgi:group I intron endonuclease
MTCGVYAIKNKLDGKMYIGSSKKIERRFNSHKYKLKRGIHDNDHLQNAWATYGAESFEFIVLAQYPAEGLFGREQEWIDLHKTLDREFGYNKTKAIPGSYFSEETREKMSKAKKGGKLSEEHKRNIGERSKGRTMSPEARQKISEARKKHTGFKMSDETKKKMSESHKGRAPTKTSYKKGHEYQPRKK